MDGSNRHFLVVLLLSIANNCCYPHARLVLVKVCTLSEYFPPVVVDVISGPSQVTILSVLVSNLIYELLYVGLSW